MSGLCAMDNLLCVVQTWRPVTFMHYMTVGAPGLIDLLVLLGGHRNACKSDRGVLALCEDYVKAAATPTASESGEVSFTWFQLHHLPLLATHLYTWWLRVCVAACAGRPFAAVAWCPWLCCCVVPLWAVVCLDSAVHLWAVVFVCCCVVHLWDVVFLDSPLDFRFVLDVVTHGGC
jgi:hypothetical protein